MPAEGLIILRDGDPGEPDVTLNPQDRVLSATGSSSRCWSPRAPDGGGDAALDDLIEGIAAALAPDPWLGGLAENLRLGALDCPRACD